MAAVGSIGRRGAAAAGVAAFALSSVVSCDAAHDASLKQRRATTDTVVGTLGTKHVIGYIWAFGGIGILTILTLSFRSSVRSDRATTVIEAAERLMMKSPIVQSVAGGPMYASGSFAIDTGKPLGKAIARGWYNASATGGVRGRVYLDATRQSRGGPWDIGYLRVVIDKAAVAARNADRRAQAVSAGYMSESDAAAANAADQAELLGEGGAAGAGGKDAQGTGEQLEPIAPGIVAVQLVGAKQEHELPDFAAMAAQSQAARAR